MRCADFGKVGVQILNLSVGLELGEFNIVHENIGRILTDGLILFLIAMTQIEMNLRSRLGQRTKMLKTGLHGFIFRAIFAEIEKCSHKDDVGHSEQKGYKPLYQSIEISDGGVEASEGGVAVSQGLAAVLRRT